MPVDRTITSPWRDEYTCTSEITGPGLRAAIYRAAARGELIRVARGVYLPATSWRELDIEGRHLARMRAVALTHPRAVFSHLSAALVRGLPIVGPPPPVPHVLADFASGGRSKTGIVRHCVGIPDEIDVIDGLKVTTWERTLLDAVSSSPLKVALPIADAAMTPSRFRSALGLERVLDRVEMLERADELASSQGSARARLAFELADGRSGSAGESVSRAGFHTLGFPMPDLQCAFVDADGLIGITDFGWRDIGVLGEFDGKGKYLRDEFTKGRSPAEVVMAEKAREDRLRALGFRVVRWDWAVARSLPALRERLIRAGVRPL